jgi:hypothetical protein
MLAIFYPRTRLLREWAYAGLTFELVGAFLSHSAAHDAIAVRAAPLTVLILLVGSYVLRPESYRLQPREERAPAGSLSVR